MGALEGAAEAALRIGKQIFAAAPNASPGKAVSELRKQIAENAQSGTKPKVGSLAGQVTRRVLDTSNAVSIGNGAANASLTKQLVKRLVSDHVDDIDKRYSLWLGGGRHKDGVPGLTMTAADPTMAYHYKSATKGSVTVAGGQYGCVFVNDFFEANDVTYVNGFNNPTRLTYFGLYNNGSGTSFGTWGFSDTKATATNTLPADFLPLQYLPRQTPPPSLISEKSQRTAGSTSLQVVTVNTGTAIVHAYAPDCYPRAMSRRTMERSSELLIYYGIPLNGWLNGSVSTLMDARKFAANAVAASDGMIGALSVGQIPEQVAASSSRTFFTYAPPIDQAWRSINKVATTGSFDNMIAPAVAFLAGQAGIDTTEIFYGCMAAMYTVQANTAAVTATIDSVFDYAMVADPDNGVASLMCGTVCGWVSPDMRCTAGCAGSGENLEEAAKNAYMDSVAHNVAMGGSGKATARPEFAKWLTNKPSSGVVSCLELPK